MRDVARRAGVSVTTVSMAMRNHASISEATRQRILRTQREMNYRPLRVMRGGASPRGDARPFPLRRLVFCLGGVERLFESEAYEPFVDGITAECQSRGLHLLLHSIGAAPSDALVLIAQIRSLGVDGVIASGRLEPNALDALADLKLPVVLLGNYGREARFPRVEVDLVTAGERLAEHLSGQRHRRLMVAMEHADHAFEREILLGIRHRFEREGKEAPLCYPVSLGRTFETGTDFVEPFLAIRPRPTALVAMNPKAANFCAVEFRAHGLKVPGDVEVVALASSAKARRSAAYRALNLQVDRCGRMAVLRLGEMLANPGMPPGATVLTPGDWLEPLQRNLVLRVASR
jgi:DNA-binding LacI/PurR family transcriptional regulator